MTETIHINGCSDDLIHINGDVQKEIYANYNEPTLLLFENGLVVKVTYTKKGTWRVRQKSLPPTIKSWELSSEGSNKVDVDYSEVLTVTTKKEFGKVYKIGEIEEV